VRLSRARKKELQWYQSGQAGNATAFASGGSGSTMTFQLDDDLPYQRKYTLVRLLLWLHVVNDADPDPIVVYCTCGVDREMNGAFVVTNPTESENLEGNKNILAFVPLFLATASEMVNTGTFHRGPSFHDIRVGRVIDPAREKLVVNMRSYAGAFKAAVDYRLLWMPA